MLWKQYGTEPAMLYRYDDLNRLIDIWYSFTGTLALPITYPTADPDVFYQYIGGSRLRSVVTNLYNGVNAYLSSYTYDLQDRLLTYTPPAPSGHGDITYTYNALGQKASITNGSLAVNYDYYANGWLKRVAKDSAPIAEYTYDAVGNRTNVALGNDAYTEYDYATGDPRYMLDAIRHYDSAETLVAEIGYARDSAGNPTSIGNEDYTYDANNRLDSQTGVEDWNYDWVGNRVHPPASPNPLVYNAADQLTAWPGQHTYDYLGTGSLYHQYDSTGQTVQKTYAYTAANLLSSVTHDDVSGVPVSSMTWDGAGNRITFSSSTGGTWRYVYEPKAIAPAVIEEIVPGGGSIYYIREPNGALIARLDGENTRYYHYDALGSTRLLTDGAGSVSDTYTYDVWGNLTGHTGSTQQPYQFVGCLGYYTHYQDANMPVVQLGVRSYDPSVGRFTQPDPARDDIDLYLYATNRPATDIDPRGLASVSPEGFQMCQGKGGSVISYTYCRNAFDTAGFAKCVGKVAWPYVVQAIVCAAKCAPSAIGGVLGYTNCMADCMGVTDPTIGTVCDDAKALKDCLNDNKGAKPEKYTIQLCTIVIEGTLFEVYDKAPPPSGGGWKRCN